MENTNISQSALKLIIVRPMYKDPDCNFDLTYILKVGEDFRINKNDRIKNIYESNFEEVPLPTEEEQPQ